MRVETMRFMGLSVLLLSLWACQSSGPIRVGVLGSGEQSAFLEVPNQLTLVSVDEVKTNYLLQNQGRGFLLPAGEHLLRVRFEQVWDTATDEHDIITSAVEELNVNLLAGERYRLQAPGDFSSLEAARAYARSYTPQLQGKQAQAGSARLNQGKKVVANSVLNVTQEHPIQTSAIVEALKTLWLQTSEQEHSLFLEWVKTLQP